ncbi:DNA endonuclease RBBP8 [Porphyridium purpureum]|uniref:DNA endonuclease RBBP8 n=1 Tax=Porphyridium purpureum TaxID=35688 RepID=A0A5J4YQQ9_PORPP|nr:DNA endonuclease RBBP8 [Porphyridium purpureum]|eukprot:POR2782..scf222_8
MMAAKAPRDGDALVGFCARKMMEQALQGMSLTEEFAKVHARMDALERLCAQQLVLLEQFVHGQGQKAETRTGRALDVQEKWRQVDGKWLAKCGMNDRVHQAGNMTNANETEALCAVPEASLVASARTPTGNSLRASKEARNENLVEEPKSSVRPAAHPDRAAAPMSFARGAVRVPMDELDGHPVRQKLEFDGIARLNTGCPGDDAMRNRVAGCTTIAADETVMHVDAPAESPLRLTPADRRPAVNRDELLYTQNSDCSTEEPPPSLHPEEQHVTGAPAVAAPAGPLPSRDSGTGTHGSADKQAVLQRPKTPTLRERIRMNAAPPKPSSRGETQDVEGFDGAPSALTGEAGLSTAAPGAEPIFTGPRKAGYRASRSPNARTAAADGVRRLVGVRKVNVPKRGKEARAQQIGATCDECRYTYIALAHGDVNKAERMMQSCSRHRHDYLPPLTPPHWAENSFPETLTQPPPGTQD